MTTIETKVPEKTRLIKVRVVGLGETKAWYGITPAQHRSLREGDVFDCWEEDFKAKWMERVGDTVTVVAVSSQEHAATVKELAATKAKLAELEKKPAATAAPVAVPSEPSIPAAAVTPPDAATIARPRPGRR